VPTGAWHFQSEAGGLGLALARVRLHRLSILTRSALPLIVREDEITSLRGEAERRLAALESLRKARRAVEAITDRRPAAQLALGHLLREATEILERPAFGEAEQTELAAVLTNITGWTDATGLVATYRAAVLARREGRECPTNADVAALDAGPVRDELTRLLGAVPLPAAIAGQAVVADLEVSDAAIARLALLWRERERSWVGSLATASHAGAPLTSLFDLVDQSLWQALVTDRQHLTIRQDAAHDESLRTFDVVRFNVDLGALDIPAARVKYHPLTVVWRVTPPTGSARQTETHGLSCVQYFHSPGSATIAAALTWRGQEIPVAHPFPLSITENLDFSARNVFNEWTEYAAIGVAALFSVATALATQYDSTYGSFSQYLALFIWSAGAATGGNLFTQLGTTLTAGGRTDAALR
jgi:hypothetical protein